MLRKEKKAKLVFFYKNETSEEPLSSYSILEKSPYVRCYMECRVENNRFFYTLLSTVDELSNLKLIANVEFTYQWNVSRQRGWQKNSELALLRVLNSISLPPLTKEKFVVVVFLQLASLHRKHQVSYSFFLL